MKHNANRFKKRDANQNPLVEVFGELFCTVTDLSAVGFGCPDLLVGVAGRNLLVEIKSGDGTPTPPQERFKRDWRGEKPYVVRTRDDAIALVQMARMRSNLHGLRQRQENADNQI